MNVQKLKKLQRTLKVFETLKVRSFYKRDAMEISDSDGFEINIKADTYLLAIEVPMLN